MSDFAYRLDLVDPIAMTNLGRTLEQGLKKYPNQDWKKQSKEEHLNHALVHIYSWFNNKEDMIHLHHAFCRLMFSVSPITDIEKNIK